MRLEIAVALFAALTLAGCGEEPLQTGPIDARVMRLVASAHVDPAAAVAKLNAYRVSRGLGPVRIDPALAAMAQRQADAMVAGNALSHDVGGSFPSRLAAAGVDTTEAGENSRRRLLFARRGDERLARIARARRQSLDGARDALRHRHRKGRAHTFRGLLGDGSGGRSAPAGARPGVAHHVFGRAGRCVSVIGTEPRRRLDRARLLRSQSTEPLAIR